VLLAQVSLKGLIQPDERWRPLFQQWVLFAQSFENILSIKKAALSISVDAELASAWKDYLFTLSPSLKKKNDEELAELSELTEKWVSRGSFKINV